MRKNSSIASCTGFEVSAVGSSRMRVIVLKRIINRTNDSNNLLSMMIRQKNDMDL